MSKVIKSIDQKFEINLDFCKLEITAIPRDMLPLDMLTPQIRHHELRQKNSRYANFSDLSTPSYAISDFFFKKIPDMLILVIYLPPAILFLIFQKKILDMLYLPPVMPF